MDFETLKSSSSNFDKITKALEKNLGPEDQANKNKYQDDRLWKPELDKTGNGYAVIRFLPASEKEEMPWQRVWSHAFQDKGGWYIENSLYSNIYIVSDPKHPENEGKVFLYKFGKKIFDKISEAMQPQFADEKAINPFDFWKGANFKLKIRKVDGYWNYDKSEFEGVTPVAKDDATIKAIWAKQYPLKPFVDPSNFKSYEELKEKLNKVIMGTRSTETVETVDLPQQVNGKVKSTNVVNSKPASEEDDTLSYFSKLADEE